MPPALEKAWHTHGYYGSVSHNVKAVYQRYMGWFDGNPAPAVGTPAGSHRAALRRGYRRYRTAWSTSPGRRSMTATSVGRQHCWITPSSPTRITPPRASSTPTPSSSSPTARRTPCGATSSCPGMTELREGNFGTPDADRLAVDHGAADARADVRHVRDQPERAPRMGSRRRRRHHLPRHRDQLPGDCCATACWSTAKRPADESTAQATIKLANKLRLLAFAVGDTSSPGLEVTGDANAMPSVLAAVDRPDPGFNIVEP